MKKHQYERDATREEFNKILPAEFETLRSAMKAKKQERMNGRLQPRFFQVMMDWKVLKLLDNGEHSVMNPYEFTKWNKANAMIEASDFKEHESLMEAYPEEKVKYEAKRMRWANETREGLRLLNRSVKLTNQQT